LKNKRLERSKVAGDLTGPLVHDSLYRLIAGGTSGSKLILEKVIPMNPKASVTLEKACEERRRSQFKKAFARLEEGIEKFPRELGLYTEAIDVGMEAGESLKTIQLFKKARQILPDEAFELWAFTAEKVQTYNDPIVGRFLLEQSIKSGDLAGADSVLANLKDRAVGELLEHIRTKKQTMSLAMATGFAAPEEIVSCTLTEAFLCLRLGRLPEAMEGFVRAIDENPSLIKPFESFLVEIESRHSESAEVNFALGCCQLASGAHSKGLGKLSNAARISPPLLARVVERIELHRKQSGFPIDLSDLTLAQLFVGLGDIKRAMEILKSTIERTPSRAPDAVEILKPAVDQVGEDIEPHFLFVEACFAAGRRETALSHLRKIHRDKRHRSRLVEWLESRSQTENGSIETRLFFAETALNEGLHAKAIEIAEEILSNGSQEAPAIKELLSRHESVELVRDYCAKKFGVSPRQDRETTYQFESYDSRGFPPRDAGPVADGDPGETESSRTLDRDFDPDGPPRPEEPSFDRPAPVPGRPARIASSEFDNCDFSLSMHDPSSADAAAADPRVGADTASEGSDLLDYLRRDFSSRGAHRIADSPGGLANSAEPAKPAARAEPAEPAAAAEPEEPVVFAEIAELARPLEPAEPAVPFEPAERPAEVVLGPATNSESSAELPNGTTEPAGSAEPAETPEIPGDFDSLYRAFTAGRLERTRIVEAAERALDENRMKEMKEILSFEPANLGEEMSRKYMLARYYLAMDRPIDALVILRSVHLGALSREQRKNFMLRIADCYRALHNFEAAHSVFLRILGDNPGSPDVERMAKSNYARYIEAAAGAVTALEKESTL
jgi:tetratricopeptide (TPR) repeat protein